MKKEEIYNLLNAEITWCKDDKNRTMPEDWHNGFIAGLKQCKNLVKLFKTSGEIKRCPYPDCPKCKKQI